MSAYFPNPSRQPAPSERMPPSKITRLRRYLPQLLALRLGKKFSIEGVKLVVFMRDRGRADVVSAKIATALRLIREQTPKGHARVRKFIPNLLVLGFHNSYAVYIADLDMCDISADFALSEGTGTEEMAMTLLHEATHGYLQSRGISYADDKRARIERICVRVEIAFAGKLPQADALVRAARQRLEYGPEYWTDASFLQREVEHFTKAGMPRFLVRRFERISSRQLENPNRQRSPTELPSLRRFRLFCLLLMTGSLVVLLISNIITVVPRLEWVVLKVALVSLVLVLYFLVIAIRTQVIIHQAVHGRPQTFNRPAPEWITALFLLCAIVAALWPHQK